MKAWPKLKKKKKKRPEINTAGLQLSVILLSMCSLARLCTPALHMQISWME